MSEFIPTSNESESEIRQDWDRIIRCLYALSELSDEIDLYEELEMLRDEDLEDALTVVFNYWIAIAVPEEESTDLQEVIELLKENGLIEGWEEV